MGLGPRVQQEEASLKEKRLQNGLAPPSPGKSQGLWAPGVTPPAPERLLPGLSCTLDSQRLWPPHASQGTGTADECSVVSLRTLACVRDQLEAGAGVCSRQMALSDLAPGNCARHATLGGTAKAWAPRVALGASSVGPTANRRVPQGFKRPQQTRFCSCLPAPCTTHSRFLWEDLEA